MNEKRDLTTDTRFRFREPLGGQLGDMPYIEIRDGEEVPPLNKANLIYVDIWHSNEPASSRLVVLWVVSDTKVVLKLYCQADDPRLKMQYQEDNSLAEKILNILLLPEQRNKQSRQYRRIETNMTIPKEELPEIFRPFVTQIEKWWTFFRQPSMKELRGRHYVSVSREGYYKAYIVGGCLKLGYVPTEEDLLLNYDDASLAGYSGFDFNPKTEPPTVFDEGVYWELPEPKILVILPHDCSNEQVAGYYGYLEQFQKYEEDKKELARRREAAHQANKAENEEKRRQQEVAARKALLTKAIPTRNALLS